MLQKDAVDKTTGKIGKWLSPDLAETKKKKPGTLFLVEINWLRLSHH
jgi:hypothetical protein